LDLLKQVCDLLINPAAHTIEPVKSTPEARQKMNDRGNREPAIENMTRVQKQGAQRDSDPNPRSGARSSCGLQEQQNGSHRSDDGWRELIAQMERDTIRRMKNRSQYGLRNLFSFVTKN
jgi:hypothetical protein